MEPASLEKLKHLLARQQDITQITAWQLHLPIVKLVRIYAWSPSQNFLHFTIFTSLEELKTFMSSARNLRGTCTGVSQHLSFHFNSPGLPQTTSYLYGSLTPFFQTHYHHSKITAVSFSEPPPWSVGFYNHPNIRQQQEVLVDVTDSF